MTRQFFFLGGERIDDLYCLRRIFREKMSEQETLMAELMSKYASGVFVSWLKNQIFDETPDAVKQQQFYFRELRNQQLDMSNPEHKQQILKLLCELCDVKAVLKISERSAVENRKRAELSVFAWYGADTMQDVTDWEYVVLEASELAAVMRKLMKKEAQNKVIHLCNTGKGDYDLRGLKLPGVRIVGHGNPICFLSDPRLNVMAELDLMRMQGMTLEGIVLQGKCVLKGLTDTNWKNCRYIRLSNGKGD